MKTCQTKFSRSALGWKESELGEIPEDWEILKFDQIAELKKETYLPKAGDNLPYLGLEHIDQQTLSINSVGSSDSVNSNKSRFESDDILFGKLRPYFKKIYQPKFDGVCSTDIWVLKAKNKIDQDWLHWFVANQDFVDMASSGSKGTKMPRADWGQVAISEWPVPPFPEQQKIAEVLGALDEKIELNRKMNKTLESLAQTVFKKWFVDDADSNWGTKKLVEVANIRKGLSYKGKDLVDNSENALAGIKCFKRGGGFNPEGLKPFVGEYKDEHLLNTGDLVVAMTDLTQAGEVLGKPALVPSIKEANKIIASLDIVALDPIAELSKEFLYLLLLRQESQDYLWGYSNGSTVLHLSINGLREFPVLAPDKDTLAKFKLIAKPIFQSIQNNENQIINLSQIRDSLLPRLMSGKLRAA